MKGTSSNFRPIFSGVTDYFTIGAYYERTSKAQEKNMWHVTLYNVFTTANTIILILIGIPFILRFIYMLLKRNVGGARQ